MNADAAFGQVQQSSAGQREESDEPHLRKSTTGFLGASSGPTRFITLGGHILAQAVQATLSVTVMQLSRAITARPICMELFTAGVMGRMAPAGQTSEQVTQLTRQ